MSGKRLANLGLEAVHYQKKSKFFNELSMAITRLKEFGVVSNRSAIDAGIDAIVKRYTGLTTTTRIDSGTRGSFNAYAMVPIIDTNSPFFNYHKEMGGQAFIDGQKINEKQLKNYVDSLKSVVDIEKGRVDGLYAKIPLEMCLGKDLVTELPSEQVAAIYLHEIGHLFTFLEIITETVSTNLAIAAASQALSKTTSPVERVQIILTYSKATGTAIASPEALASADMSADGYQMVLLRETMESTTRSATGAHIYDLRNSEFAADHFASMQGAGRDLALALDAIYKHYGVNTRSSRISWMVTEAFKVALLISAAVVGWMFPGASRLLTIPVMVGLTLIIGKMDRELYDEPAARIERIRNNLVQALKDQSLNRNERAKILEDIEMIDDLKKDMVDRRTLLKFIWTSLTPGRRRQYNQIIFQKELEALINNPLFITATRINQLAEK